MQQLIWPLVVGFLLSLAAGPVVLPILRRLKMGQSVRDDGPQTHLIKQGTPTIGGLIFLFGGLVSALLFTRQSYGFAVFSVLITLGFGAVGFLDDYITGDKYFKTYYPAHNLDRARCQMRLAQDMYKKLDAMDDIVSQIAHGVARR